MSALSTKMKYYTPQQCNENQQIMLISVWIWNLSMQPFEINPNGIYVFLFMNETIDN